MATIKVDMSGVPKKISRLKKNRKLGLYLSAQAAAGMYRYVPKREKILAGNPDTSVPFMVTYNTPYAHYIWNGISYNRKGEPVGELKYTEPGTVSHWDKHYAKAHGEELGRAATKYAKGL